MWLLADMPDMGFAPPNAGSLKIIEKIFYTFSGSITENNWQKYSESIKMIDNVNWTKWFDQSK